MHLYCVHRTINSGYRLDEGFDSLLSLSKEGPTAVFCGVSVLESGSNGKAESNRFGIDRGCSTGGGGALSRSSKSSCFVAFAVEAGDGVRRVRLMITKVPMTKRPTPQAATSQRATLTRGS